MKNKFILNLCIYVAVVTLFTTLPCFAAENVEVRTTAIKFIMAMGGVVLSTVIIFLGLTIYNKLFVEKKIS